MAAEQLPVAATLPARGRMAVPVAPPGPLCKSPPPQSSRPTNRLSCAAKSSPTSKPYNRANKPPTGREHVIAAKNSLTAADAQLVEEAFEQRLADMIAALEQALTSEADDDRDINRPTGHAICAAD